MHARGCATCDEDDAKADHVRPNFTRLFARTFAERSQQGVRDALPFPSHKYLYLRKNSGLPQT